jgi:hypothetical protein
MREGRVGTEEQREREDSLSANIRSRVVDHHLHAGDGVAGPQMGSQDPRVNNCDISGRN